MKMSELKIHAQRCLEQNKPLQVLIDMPGFAAPELIVNPPENIQKKVDYYVATYDENCQHKHAKGIAIVDVVEAMDIGQSLSPLVGIAEGHVRYSGTTYIGEVSEDLTVEGSAEDVIKVLGAVHSLPHEEKL